MATYRRRRAAGEFADDPFGDVFLVVDGWGTLRQDYEELETAITTLAGRGLGFGVHVVLTAARWAEIRINMRDLLRPGWSCGWATRPSRRSTGGPRPTCRRERRAAA